LAIGMLAMHRGTEVPTDPHWPVITEICQYDIKPDNSKNWCLTSWDRMGAN
jgi:hypothetical protein